MAVKEQISLPGETERRVTVNGSDVQPAKLVNVVIPPLEQRLTYAVPRELEAHVAVGTRVKVPLGRRVAFGFVIELLQQQPPDASFAIKEVRTDAEPHPCFAASQLPFFQKVADYYGAPLSEVIDVAVPPALPARVQRSVTLNPDIEETPRGSLQSRIVQLLRDAGGALDYSQLLREGKGASNALRTLAARNIVTIHRTELVDSHLKGIEHAPWAATTLTLNDEQQEARRKISAATAARRFEPFLLHGVTGSGKTEVYIEVIREALAQGRGALVIVPEIALTPQLIDRFRARLGDDIAVLHSALNPRVRWDAWRALLAGRNRVAIGARSAVFAPIKDLAVIVVDEEHDGSFKQSEGLRYNARDVALLRAKLEQCPVVLGSATPSLESYHHARTGRYTYQPLPSRHSAAPLEISLVDLNTLKPWEMVSRHVSPLLHQRLRAVLDRGEQAFVLYNRRGFASYLQCERCETVVECPHCSVTLTLHRHANSLLCHYCGVNRPPPEFCPECLAREAAGKLEHGTVGRLLERGAGTERVFDELRELFPEVQIDRLDRDAASDIDTYRAILNRVRDGTTKILVGTQMIAKGHDLPGVTLVGVIDCDVGLHMPDFRAGERVFQLLTQAAGRAGRGAQQGSVVLQTRVPKHPSLVRTLHADFQGFAEEELATRRALRYPPFARILRIVASAAEEELPMRVLTEWRERISRLARASEEELVVMGPAPAPLQRLRTMWRWHLLVKSARPSALSRVQHLLKPLLPNSKKVKIVFDVDPQELL